MATIYKCDRCEFETTDRSEIDRLEYEWHTSYGTEAAIKKDLCRGCSKQLEDFCRPLAKRMELR